MEDLKDIKARAISGSVWSIVEKFSLQIVQFIVGIVLARLLGPGEFGLVAMTTVFLVIPMVIAEGGFEKSLIREEHLSDVQISTVFYVNASLSVLMTVLMWISAPFIAIFFHEPLLKNVLMVLAFGLPIDALGQTQRTLLSRSLQFKKISIGQICCSLVTGITGIILAYSGFGVWALVYSSLAGTTTWVAIYWIGSSWYPKWMFSYSSIKRIMPFGLNILATSLLVNMLQQFNNFIVGRYFSKAVLGEFNRGGKFPDMISATIQSVVTKISFPVFVKLQNNEYQLNNALRKSFGISALISFPLLTFLFIDARQIVLLLLTDKWLGCVVFLKLFCVYKLFEPFISIQREMLLAKGYARLLLRLFVITSLFEIIPIMLFVKYGIMYVIWISVISKAIQYVIYHLVVSAKLKADVWGMFTWLLPHFCITAVVAGCILLLQIITPASINGNLLIKLAIDFLAGASIYLLAGYLLKLKEMEFIKLGTSFFKNVVPEKAI
ncbi:MAG: lipopolysaccharide biosynthesis protein [Bacteroidota bacterium]